MQQKRGNPAAGRREPPGPVRPGPIPSRDTTPPAPDRDRPTPPTAGCAWTRRACGQHRRPSAGFRDDLHLVRLADLGLRPTERSSTSTTSPTAGDWTCVWSKSWPWIPPGLPAHPRTVPGPQRQRLRRLPSPSPPLRDSAVRACNAAPARRKPLACSWRRSPGFLHLNSGPDTPRSVTQRNHTSSTAPRMPAGGPRAGTSSTIGPFGQVDERDEAGGVANSRSGPYTKRTSYHHRCDVAALGG